MKSFAVAKYLVGYDIFRDASEREKAIYADHGSDPNLSLPFDAGIEGALDIYAIRVATIAKQTGAIVCRTLGIDAAYRLATNTEFPQQ